MISCLLEFLDSGQWSVVHGPWSKEENAERNKDNGKCCKENEQLIIAVNRGFSAHMNAGIKGTEVYNSCGQGVGAPIQSIQSILSSILDRIDPNGIPLGQNAGDRD